MRTIEAKKVWLWGSLVLLAAYLLPLVLYNESLSILVFDNLDSNVVWYKILAESGLIFAPNDAIVPNMMNGLPRSCYGSEFDALLWLYYFFTPIQAYVVNELILRLVAFGSMYLFLDRIVFDQEHPGRTIYVNAGALYFALLPFWPSGGLSIPLMPLVTYALLKIEEGKASWRTWLILVLTPFYASFVLVYFFYFVLAGIYFIRQTVVHRRFNAGLFSAMVLVTILFLLKDYRLVLQMFFESGFVSNRSEYYSLVNDNFIEAYRSALLQFLDGVPHGKGTHLSLLLPISLFALFLSLSEKKLSLRVSMLIVLLFSVTYLTEFWNLLLKQIYTLPLLAAIYMLFLFRKTERLLPALFLFQVMIALWFGFSFYEGWEPIFETIPIMKMFNFSRFFFISQMIWGVIAALAVRIIVRKLQFGGMMVALFLGTQLYISSKAAFFGMKTDLYHMPFSKFYAQSQFQQIKKYIGKPQNSYRVVSLGIDPAVSLFNGFHTLDGYMVNYPLDYKHEFRKIIERYLEQQPFYRDLYDGWGSKTYLFDHDVDYAYYNEFVVRATHTGSYEHLDVNVSKVAQMGGEYLLSAQQIKAPEKYGLVYLDRFDNNGSLWSVNLYEIKHDENN